MDDPLPNFDSPTEPTEPAPRKPRAKPTKRMRKPAVVPARKRRKRRAVRVAKNKPDVGGHRLPYTKTRFTPQVYKLIGELMELDVETRNLAIEVAKGLSR